MSEEPLGRAPPMVRFVSIAGFGSNIVSDEETTNFFCDRGTNFFLDVRENDVGSILRELASYELANSLRSACDDRDLIVKTVIGCHNIYTESKVEVGAAMTAICAEQ
jgi:hypothetical protein